MTRARTPLAARVLAFAEASRRTISSCSSLHQPLTFQANTSELDGLRLKSLPSPHMRPQNRGEDPFVKSERAPLPKSRTVELRMA